MTVCGKSPGGDGGESAINLHVKEIALFEILKVHSVQNSRLWWPAITDRIKCELQLPGWR